MAKKAGGSEKKASDKKPSTNSSGKGKKREETGDNGKARVPQQ
jgi:hypothetical protein